MDVKLINPFLNSVHNIMPQLGFQNIVREGMSVKPKAFKVSGVVLMLGIVGDIKGNVVYYMSLESAKKIASTMMMGMPVNELDDMAKSAISELSNMLTANASINFSTIGINVNISTPTMMYGEDFEVNLNQEQVISVKVNIDGIPMEIDISLES